MAKGRNVQGGRILSQGTVYTYIYIYIHTHTHTLDIYTFCHVGYLPDEDLVGLEVAVYKETLAPPLPAATLK